jgi:hypothetical protein
MAQSLSVTKEGEFYMADDGRCEMSNVGVSLKGYPNVTYKALA